MANSDLDEHLVTPDLAAKPMDRLSSDRGTAPRVESEPPVMQGTDDLAVLNPADPERAVGMWTAAEQGVNLAAVVEDGDPQVLHLNRQTAPLDDVGYPADRAKRSQRHLPGTVPRSSKRNSSDLRQGLSSR